MEEALKARRVWFKDGLYYLKWWVGIVGIFGGFQLYGSGLGMADAFLTAFLMAGLDSLLFTLAQNLLNRERKKPVSWLLAFVIWTGMKFFFYYLSTL